MVHWDKEIWCQKKLFDIIEIWHSAKISSYRREERNSSLLKCNAPGTIEHKVLLHLVYFSNNSMNDTTTMREQLKEARFRLNLETIFQMKSSI